MADLKFDYDIPSKPLEATREQALDLWKAAAKSFGYDGPFTLQLPMDVSLDTVSNLRAAGFDIFFR